MSQQVNGDILVKKKSFLISKRPGNKIYSGFWEFPGGKPEKGESNAEVIRRELMEELGVKTRVGELITNYNYKFLGNVYDLWFYKTRITKGQIKLNAHDKLAWIDPNNFSKFKLLPGDIPALEKILSKRV